MRLIRYLNQDGVVRYGREGPSGEAFPLVGDVFGEHAFAKSADVVSKLLAPAQPPNILAIGRNYRDHAAEMKAAALPTEPLVFLKATTSVIGSGESIELPQSAPEEVDFEGELAVVIGRRARDVSESEAAGYVLGYTCANDVTARDCQHRRDQQWARGKSFDTFCPVGPAIVSADEFDPGGARLKTILNGQVMQDGRTSDLIFGVPFLISYLSRQFTLLPGTLILTGTPAGVGAARKPPVYLRRGDEIEVEIEGIGKLRNVVRGIG